MARKRNLLLLTIALPVIVFLGLIFSLGLSKQLTYAQGGGIYVNKQLGRSSPVVHVGEYLTFTILIRNDTAFTVTRLPLRDNYNASVLGQPDAIPAPDTIDPTGQLDWDDLTTYFGDLAPGEQVIVIVGFIAEHPEPAVVNRAEVHDALNENGDLIGNDSTITDTESVGGSAPVEKVLQEGLTPQAGQLLTFTIVITNEGYTTMTLVPLVDTYNPAWLAFSYGDPPPDQIDAARGVLTWTNLTDWTGYIPPHGTVSVTTVFTALGATDQGLNRAEIVGASDWYGNDMGGGADDVPITIIGPDTTPTATPGVGYPTPINTPTPAAPTSTPKPDQPRPSTPAPTFTPYPTPTVTATVFVLLPETGKPTPLPVGLLFALLVIGSGVTFLSIARRHH